MLQDILFTPPNPLPREVGGITPFFLTTAASTSLSHPSPGRSPFRSSGQVGGHLQFPSGTSLTQGSKAPGLPSGTRRWSHGGLTQINIHVNWLFCPYRGGLWGLHTIKLADGKLAELCDSSSVSGTFTCNQSRKEMWWRCGPLSPLLASFWPQPVSCLLQLQRGWGFWWHQRPEPRASHHSHTTGGLEPVPVSPRWKGDPTSLPHAFSFLQFLLELKMLWLRQRQSTSEAPFPCGSSDCNREVVRLAM